MDQGRFSERHGFVPPPADITIRHEAPHELRGVLVDLAYNSGMAPTRLRSVVCGVLLTRPDDNTVKAIANGRREDHKQDATYVRVGKRGEVLSRPSVVSSEAAKAEVERSERIGQQLRPYGRDPGLDSNIESEKLIALFKLLTGRLALEDFNAYWWAR